jgi:hypothetical protein
METADALERPFPMEVLKHPFFWTGQEKVRLFLNLSDFLQSQYARVNGLGPLFERRRREVTGADWTKELDRSLLLDASQFAIYSGKTLADLVRLIRNKCLHTPHDARGGRLEAIGTTYDDYFAYFNSRFPNLFLYSYYFVEQYRSSLL